MVRVNQKIWLALSQKNKKKGYGLAKMFTVMLASLVLSMPEPVAVLGTSQLSMSFRPYLRYVIIRPCVEHL